MNQFDKIVHNLWRSDFIRSGQNSSLYFTDKNAEQRDVDVIRLAEEIARKYPELLKKLLTFTVDAKSRNSSLKDVLGYLGSQDKGASVNWHDRDCNEVFFVNTDNNLSKGKEFLVAKRNSCRR